MRWSEAGYLSQFVLTHALRQVSLSLILGVRQKEKLNRPQRIALSSAVAALLVGGVFWYQSSRHRMYWVDGTVDAIYRAEPARIAVSLVRDGDEESGRQLIVSLGLRKTSGAEVEPEKIEIGKQYRFMIFKPKKLETPVAWAAFDESERKK